MVVNADTKFVIKIDTKNDVKKKEQRRQGIFFAICFQIFSSTIVQSQSVIAGIAL